MECQRPFGHNEGVAAAGTGAKPRVLVVDDNDDIRYLLRMSLEDDFAIDVVASAADALARIERGERFDIVITDVIQPGMNGIELTERLRENQPSLPVVVLSAWITTRNAHVAIDAGARVAMAKPFRADDLIATLTHLVG